MSPRCLGRKPTVVRVIVRQGSGLTITRGVSLILLALLFGVIAVRALPEGPTHWSRYATQFADVVWRIYFGTILTLCVAALVLGILSLTKPAAHPVYSVIAGVGMIVVGLAGGVLGYLSVTDVEDMGTPLALHGIRTSLCARRRDSHAAVCHCACRPTAVP